MVQHPSNKSSRNNAKPSASRIQYSDNRGNNQREVTQKNPNYLRNVESKIKDQVRMTRTHMMYQNQNTNYDIPIQIFEGPKL